MMTDGELTEALAREVMSVEYDSERGLAKTKGMLWVQWSPLTDANAALEVVGRLRYRRESGDAPYWERFIAILAEDYTDPHDAIAEILNNLAQGAYRPLCEAALEAVRARG